MLAPMEGITHPVFRSLMVRNGGLHLVCTEFVRITSAANPPSRLRAHVQKAAGCPLSVQVMGNDVEQMAFAAHEVERAGADVVDINLGCPMPRVVRKGVGAALLKNPNLLARVLGQMRASTAGLLSAKLRAGFDSADAAVETAQLVAESGVDFIAIHPRRRCDFYAGVADWRIIASIREAVAIPVVGNGDVWYAKDALRMQAETGADAVMIGRPALRNPWIFRQLDEHRRGLSPFAPGGRDVHAFLVGIVDEYSQGVAGRRRGIIGPVKELVRWLARAIDREGDFARRALRLDSVDAILSMSERELAPLSADALDLLFEGHRGFETSGSAEIAEQEQHGRAV